MDTNHREVTDDAPAGAFARERRAEPLSPINETPHHVAARGFGQAFSLHPLLSFGLVGGDMMVSAVDAASLGMSAAVLWLIFGVFSFFVVFRGQQKWGGDDKESALLKAVIVSFLCALPTPFPAMLTIPSGISGAVQMLRRKEQ